MVHVAMGTDEKRRPGLFETIIRRSIPLVVARCDISSLSRVRRGGSQIVYADKNSPTTMPGVASLSIANCF